MALLLSSALRLHPDFITKTPPSQHKHFRLNLSESAISKDENPIAHKQWYVIKLATQKLDFALRIDKTTYHVKAHFKKTGKENMSDKIKRMLHNEASRM